MKKIDLHIHTVSTFCETDFTFCLDAFKKYVTETSLDAVAVTNHDIFDEQQFLTIRDALDIIVFPGIEARVGNGHVLIIADGLNITDFSEKCKIVESRISSTEDSISVEELKSIFGDLSDYLVIPHYDKSPALSGNHLQELSPFFVAGEVQSPKKFIRLLKNSTAPTPVLFSDARIRKGMNTLPPRHTCIDCGDLTLAAIKQTLSEKSNVALTTEEGNELWPVFSDGLMLSTGLNVLLGGRSSGKTYTLKKIAKLHENIKHIEQFQLVQRSEKEEERVFNKVLEKSKSAIIDRHLSDFKGVVDEVMNVDIQSSYRETEDYIESLLKFAKNVQDAFSLAAIYRETPFTLTKSNQLEQLIRATEKIIENVSYRNIIEDHIDLEDMKALACELIEKYREEHQEEKKKLWVNELIRDVQTILQRHSSSELIKDVRLYDVCLDEKRVRHFNELVRELQKEGTVLSENLPGFTVEATKKPFANATDIQKSLGIKCSLVDAYAKYPNPYEYLRALFLQGDISNADIYKFFVKIDYRVLNKDGKEASGGERSEFNLLQEISDAKNFEALLIDEPESSFDNIFLNSDVNKIIKQLSITMPVVVVTHNNTVGASIEPNYLLYAERDDTGSEVNHKLYFGYPTDKELTTKDGESIPTHTVLMGSLEAGEEAYDKRRLKYEAVKN
ncbi:MAG: phosphotransferase [Gammaproteobacteria bacterium]